MLEGTIDISSLLLTLQQFRLLLALMLIRGSRIATTENAVSISGETQV